MTVVKKESQEPAGELPDAGDYFVLETPFSSWYLSVEMARAVDRDLTATPLPEWTVFVDLAGARVRLRTSRVESLVQCTAEQRAACRDFNRRLKKENDANRAWEEED
jgi:hypothetical protein